MMEASGVQHLAYARFASFTHCVQDTRGNINMAACACDRKPAVEIQQKTSDGFSNNVDEL